MKKQLLFTGLALVFGVSATSYLYLEKKSNKSYEERAEIGKEEPFSLKHFRLNQNGELDPQNRIDALKALNHRASRATPIGLNFAFRGPDNVGGRTRAMLELYGKGDTLLAGGMTGGLFVSTNGGAYWQPHPQFQNLTNSSAIVSAIVQDTIRGTIYIGTGSSFDAGGTNLIEMPGYGIYKSDDEGATFTHIESTEPENRLDYGDLWTAINRLAVTPNGDLYAATESGLWATHDGGETWENPIYADPNFTFPANGTCADVATTKSGRVVAAFATGAIHISEDGSDKSFVRSEGSGLPTGGVTRSVLALYPGDEDIMYVAFTASDNSLQGIYKTTNGGENWTRTLAPFDDFSPYCSAAQCQGDYDACIAVSPVDPNTIFIGGVEIWRYDGNLTRVASEFGSPPASDVLPFYVHADKHYIYFSPNNRNRMYVASDGGLTKTLNRGETWQGINKGYSTTQFYGIAFAPEGGVLLAGAQDNGSIALPNDNANDPFYGVQANGGDGFDAEISQASGIYFATSQYGVLVRGENNLPSAALSGTDRSSPFWTVTRLWENTNDPTSKDSIVFNNDSIEQSIAVSNGTVKAYRETITPTQSAARVIKNSVRVFSGDQRFSNELSIDSLIGDGTGSITFENDGSFTVDVSFTDAPSENSNIFVQYAVRYKANDVLTIESVNLNANLSSFFFEHRLENALNPGDKVIIQDPVQSLLAKSIAGGLGIYRGVLNMQEPPTIINLNKVGGGVNGVEFTSDGNVAYVAAGSSVYRVRGLNRLYTAEDATALYSVPAGQTDTTTLIKSIFTASGGQVTGLSLDPNDDSRMIVSVSGYGNDANVVELTNAYYGSVAASRNLHGDLPTIPVYDIQIDANDPNLVLLGTEFGIWATKDASATSVEWTDENSSLTYTPVFDIRQQRLPFSKAKNSGMYYIATYGRGMWESSSLVGIKDFPAFNGTESSISSFKVYPNPISDVGTIEFETNYNGNATITVYDFNGRIVQAWEDRVSSGQNRSTLNVSALRSGTYFVTLEVNGQSDASKFIVLK